MLNTDCTIGRLYINDEQKEFCYTLEDRVRDKDKSGQFDNGELKVAGETAIPYGTYEVTLQVQSPRFKDKAQYAFCNGYLPRLLDVPDFEGVLIHIGNSAKDTDGCILVGEYDPKTPCWISNSTATFKKLYERLQEAYARWEKITIEIV